MAVATLKPSSRDQRSSFWESRGMRRFRRNGLAISGLVMIVIFTLIAIFAPVFAKPTGNCLRDLGGSLDAGGYFRAIVAPPATCFEIARYSFSDIPTPPGKDAFLGTTQGFDIWYGIVWGTRTAFFFSFVVVFGQVLIGVFLGSISGYFGGWIDNLIMRVVDVIFAFPGLILTITLVSVLGKSIWVICIALIAVGWAGYARLIRGSILKTRSLEFVDGARALGASTPRIIFSHVLPNSLTAIVTSVVLDMGSTVLSAAALAFLGLGLEIGYADWGQLMSFARSWVQEPKYWYVTLFPGLVLLLWGLSWNLLGDALRDALDPREL